MSGTVSIKGVDSMVLDTGESGFDAEARRRGERIAEMGGRRVPGGVEKVKGLRSAETAEDGSLRAGAEEVSGEFHATEEFRDGMGWETPASRLTRRRGRRMPPVMGAWQPERQMPLSRFFFTSRRPRFFERFCDKETSMGATKLLS